MKRIAGLMLAWMVGVLANAAILTAFSPTQDTFLRGTLSDNHSAAPTRVIQQPSTIAQSITRNAGIALDAWCEGPNPPLSIQHFAARALSSSE